MDTIVTSWYCHYITDTPTPLLLPEAPGSYLLVLRLAAPALLIVGTAGTFPLRAADYVYVGSARGRGGLAARVGRHLKPATEKRPRWHIDRLTAVATPMAVIAATHPAVERQECRWARLLGQQEGVIRPIPRFGSSDCACPGHLFRWPCSVVPEALARLLLA